MSYTLKPCLSSPSRRATRNSREGLKQGPSGGVTFDDTDRSGPDGAGAIPRTLPTYELLCFAPPANARHRPVEPTSVSLQRTATELEPLLDYLNQPSKRSTQRNDVACQATVWTPLWLILVDDARNWTVPRSPPSRAATQPGLY